MKVVKADFGRHIELAGVAAPVPRPVDIDQSQTGFRNLRTLRIYRFDSGSVIDGHAEEDEVFIVVLSGSVELTMTVGSEPGQPKILSGPNDADGSACAAYLPPHAVYRLVPHNRADVAYARATPVGSRPPKVLPQAGTPHRKTQVTSLEETTYAEKLRLRLIQIDATRGPVMIAPMCESETTCEAFVHVRNVEAGAATILPSSGSASVVLDSWDTVALTPGERPMLRIGAGSALVLVFFSA
ncbi:MAG: 5-deoxy-glucuronate isomerase [Terriglobales bacterium]